MTVIGKVLIFFIALNHFLKSLSAIQPFNPYTSICFASAKKLSLVFLFAYFFFLPKEKVGCLFGQIMLECL